MKTKVRFAPSPTGSLHIGGARTALFNWLFARHTKGEFVLRIEDTDIERSTKEFEQSILDGMRWLGLDWDGELVYQTQRMDLYKEYVQKMLNTGHAYYCTCTPELLDQKRELAAKEGRKPVYDGTCRNNTTKPAQPAAIRFKSPQEGVTSFKDLCRGTITFENKELDDLVIARSDGTPTYNFCVVIDDATMDITHVIRGDDHINNTPRQILMYQALGFPLPQFAHLPMIHGQDKKKLSKRHGATSVIEYQEMGFLPDGIVNYLARLGWSHQDQEIFSRAELIEFFNLEAIGQSPSIFDMEKCGWVNGQHMLKLSNEEVFNYTKPFLEKLGYRNLNASYAAKCLATERERSRNFKELAEVSAFYFDEEAKRDEATLAALKETATQETLKKILAKLEGLSDWSESSIHTAFDGIMQETGLKMGKVGQPCRMAVTGMMKGPGLMQVLELFGKEKVLKRLKEVLT